MTQVMYYKRLKIINKLSDPNAQQEAESDGAKERAWGQSLFRELARNSVDARTGVYCLQWSFGRRSSYSPNEQRPIRECSGR